ncbi:Zinc finger bed domain-containing protein [Thalictrum thalictroides]|uniref:Zinc finger bed domain-containing protein n=1 Tax=Thalictrum thalictroides TaxID=46969 RepID=A0A7J6WJE2_THATH|nr:Zinc finger bed domain-containing protein [Thalictrum thalictroides]
MDSDRVDGEVVPPLQFVKVEHFPSPDVIILPLPTESESCHPSNLINGSEATSSRKRKILKSDAWNHFDIIDVKKDDGTVDPKAQCKYCGKHLSSHYTSGTSHLKRHIKRCHSQITPNIRPGQVTCTPPGEGVVDFSYDHTRARNQITPNTRTGQVTCTPPGEGVVDFTYDHTRACRELARFIVIFELSFSMGEDPHFQEMTQSFNPQSQPVSRFTISDIVMENFEEEKSKLHSLLHSVPGKICLTSAFWTTEQGDGKLASDISIPYQWNTTYLMLDEAIPYQRIFELFFYDSTLEFVPTTTDWKNAVVARELLKVFYEASKSFSGLKYVSSSEFCHKLSNICLVLSKYETDPFCGGIVESMKSKFKEYWTEISPVVELAACMDPRYKITFLEVCLEVIFGYEETHRLGGTVEKIKKALKEVFDQYTQKKGGNVLKEPSDSYEEKQVGGVIASTFSNIEDPTFAIYAKRREASSQRCESELERYLAQSPLDVDTNKPLDVLDWWKAQEGNYPLLSAMARDLLTVPVSSVPLELAFDSSERSINRCRSYISPKLLEASVCLRDWYKAQEGSQHANLSELKDLMTEKDF